MISFTSYPSFQRNHKKIDNDEQPQLTFDQKLSYALTHRELKEDTVNISKKNKQPHEPKPIITTEIDLTYVNVLGKALDSTPNPNFIGDIKKVSGIISAENAALRVSSLSTYLKTKMVGFVVPEYENQGVKKGGYQWFERGLENLLKGSKKKHLQPEEYKDTAKELFGLLSVHDKYWKSPEFADYLTSLKKSKTINENQIKAVESTIEAIGELNGQKNNKPSFKGKETVVISNSNFTPMKLMDKLLEYCAYSGIKMDHDSEKLDLRPSAEHIIPCHWIENYDKEDQNNFQNDDGNYLIAASKANSDRYSMPLLLYLKGGNPKDEKKFNKKLNKISNKVN